MKVKFIQPYSGEKKGLLTNYDFLAKMHYPIKRVDIPNRMLCMSIILPTLAALTPPSFDIEILDESVQYIDYDDPVDIVALTGLTYMVPYAYNLAREFKKRGVYVAMGGIHASTLPDEALQYVDTVFIGEGENIWREFIDDFKKGKPKKKYQETSHVNLNEFILPRWDLVKKKYYPPYFIQASRGCNLKCDFCQYHQVFNQKIRYKPIENVIAEIKQLYSLYRLEFIGGAPMLFCDDNIIADKNEAKKLFKGLISLNIKWFALATSDVARDKELLNLMVKSGCDHLSIGFESISQKSLDLVNKGTVNMVNLYRKDINTLHSKGITVSGLMIFGLDADEPSIFRETVNFINETNLEFPIFNTLMPFPKTVLREKLEQENRVICNDWKKYSGNYSCIKPKKMTAEELEHGTEWTIRQVYSEKSILKRINDLHKEGKGIVGEKYYFTARFIFTLLFIKEVFRRKFILKEKQNSQFIWKMIKIMWTKKKIKIGSILFFINYFEFSQKIPQ